MLSVTGTSSPPCASISPGLGFQESVEVGGTSHDPHVFFHIGSGWGCFLLIIFLGLFYDFSGPTGGVVPWWSELTAWWSTQGCWCTRGAARGKLSRWKRWATEQFMAMRTSAPSTCSTTTRITTTRQWWWRPRPVGSLPCAATVTKPTAAAPCSGNRLALGWCLWWGGRRRLGPVGELSYKTPIAKPCSRREDGQEDTQGQERKEEALEVRQARVDVPGLGTGGCVTKCNGTSATIHVNCCFRLQMSQKYIETDQIYCCIFE